MASSLPRMRGDVIGDAAKIRLGERGIEIGVGDGIERRAEQGQRGEDERGARHDTHEGIARLQEHPQARQPRAEQK